MKIHKEGYQIIFNTVVLFSIISIIAYVYTPLWLSIALIIISLLIICFTVRFFRVPNRIVGSENNDFVYSPADGTVVAIEEIEESEYLQGRRIQVSVFMSIWDVHINWFPVGGRVEYFQHHNGLFRVAWHPKSSTENERTTTVINTGSHQILFRQIAGYVARRIVNYTNRHTGDQFHQNQECGFIKFGSRVDLILPLGTDVRVKLNDKVIGTQTIIAELPKKHD